MNQDFFSFEKNPILEYSPLEKRGLFIGCEIKNKYDENRICIKESFNPTRIKHLDKMFYGVLLPLLDEHSALLNVFEKYKNIDLFFYNKTLNEYKLSCEDNFLYLDYGMYPIHSKHIVKYLPKFSYNNFFIELDDLPNYQRIKSINMMFMFPNQYSNIHIK